MSGSGPNQLDLLSDIRDTDLLRFMLADLHDDLDGRLRRFRYLADLGMMLGSGGTMLPGGRIVELAYAEARSSFVSGNFIATVILCQSMTENMLAAHLLLPLEPAPVPNRVQFRKTLEMCRDRKILSEDDEKNLLRLSELRNPLVHFRTVDDASQLDRRSIDKREHALVVVERDAYFAIGIVFRLMAKPEFRLGL